MSSNASFAETMHRLIAMIAVLGTAIPAHPELPHIRLDRIFPVGGKAGSEVLLDIQGRDLDEVKTLHVDHAGIKALHLKDRQFRLTVAAHVPPGTYEIRAVGKFGISGVRLFAVQRGLTEVQEKEPNDSPDQAQAVPMNSAVNGHSDGNGDDFFRFPAKKGERLIIDGQVFRLDSTMRAMLTLSTMDGRDLLQSKPYYQRTDPLLDFTAPTDGDYILRIHDMTFGGGMPYRLLITNLPHLENAFPNAVLAGDKTELTLQGRNLPGDRLTTTITVPRDPRIQRRFTYANHLLSPSLNARGLQFWPDQALNPVTLALADAPITLDQEPNNTADTAQTITLPSVICGRFDKPGDADWYTFTGKAGDVWTVDLLCERLNLPGDPFVLIFDGKGNELATFDDHGINTGSLAQFNRDPLGTFRVPAGGKYHVFVQERYRNGGLRYQYVLQMTKPTPDFFPVVCHETPSDPTCPVVRQGGSAHYDFCLNRRDYNGPVTIEAADLPPGVLCPPVHVSPQTQTATVVLTAAVNAPDFSGPIRLKAWAMIDGNKLEREVRGAQRRWAIQNINTTIMVRQIGLAVRSQAPYGLTLPEQNLTVAAGATLSTKACIVRHWPDFQGKVQLNALNFPPGFSFATVDIPADKTLLPIQIKVAANVPPGEYSLVLRGDAQVPYHRDVKAANRPLTRVADPSTPLKVTVVPAKKK